VPYIYRIVSPTGGIYIGKTVDIKRRRNEYHSCHCKSQPIVYNSLLKYGFDAHRFELVEEVPEDKLNEREAYWIDFYKSNTTQFPQFGGMNLTGGGEGTIGYVFTEEHKKKLSESLKGREVLPETRLKLSKAHKGKKFSEEHKKHLSESLTGKPSPFKGKHHIEDAKNKLRLLRIGKCHSDESKQKMSDINKGKHKGCLNGMYDRKGFDSPTSKIILDTETGVFYGGIREASETYNINFNTLAGWLNGRYKNKSNLIYV